MKILQEVLNATIEKMPRTLVAELLQEKLAAQGVNLSRRRCEKLARQAIEEKLDSLHLPWWQFWQYRYFRRPKQLLIDFTPEDSQKITTTLEKTIPDLIQRIISERPENILAELKKSWRSEFRRQLRDQQRFRRRFNARWNEPLDQLRMLLTIAREFGSTVNRDLRQRATGEERYLADVLTRLHARACQITSEVECLLSAGFSDGAMARWRTLHEVAVVIRFISEHGAECAERYTNHQIVESRKAAKNYERCQSRLGYEPISQSEMEEVERSFQFVVDKYGAQFREQYGWAHPYLDLPDSARVNFSNIEEAVGVDHLRAHYQMASHNVHANPKGVFFKLGLVAESDVLLAGSSDMGLADPGHASALSLIQACSALMTIDPTLDNIILVKLMSKLANEIGDNFLAANQRAEPKIT